MSTVERIASTTVSELDSIMDAAVAAGDVLARLSPIQRAEVLDSIADTLDDKSRELVPIAFAETHLPIARLEAEVKRTSFQLRLMAKTIRSGSYLGAVINEPDASWPPGPRPDLRRVLTSVGPVAVFTASNFPFAFSVLGGDTASALAAGCSVIVKAHSGHPLLSKATFDIARAAIVSSGLPEAVISIIFGTESGRHLILDERLQAAAFTGSTNGGRALFDLANSRPRPIPFYGELGSVNPVFVTRNATNRRGSEIWEGFVESFTLGAGQFCTKPGIIFVPSDCGAVKAIAERLVVKGSFTLLNERISNGFSDRVEDVSSHPSVKVVVRGTLTDEGVTPSLFTTDIASFIVEVDTLLDETFGPASLVVTYASEDELLHATSLFTGELTATLQAERDDAIVPQLVTLLESRAGRLLWNNWPTGVAVTSAMQHGGPYPASTSSRDTSVGVSAIERFLRPIAYQNFPDEFLPPALRQSNPWSVKQTHD